MYVRQLAWLHATPKGRNAPRVKALIEAEQDISWRFPSLDGADFIIQLLQEAGLSMPGAMGEIPLSWCEIDAWLRTSQRDVPVWQRMLIKDLSEVYVNEKHVSTDPNHPAPYTPVQIDRAAVDKKIRGLFSSLKANKK